MQAHRRTAEEREPTLSTDLDLGELPRPVRFELRALREEVAEIVGGHLLMAGQLVDVDPSLAFAHAEAARRRAPRLPITREASAETAYAAGEYQYALTEFRTLRRLTGSDELLPVMADCERALGRLPEALELAQEGTSTRLDPDVRTEALLVVAGVREDMGQAAEALRLLKRAATQSLRGVSRPTRARLLYGYADLLVRSGDEDEALRWFVRAAEVDSDHETDAEDRVAALQGLVLELDEAGPEAWDEPEHEHDVEDRGDGGAEHDAEGESGDSGRREPAAAQTAEPVDDENDTGMTAEADSPADAEEAESVDVEQGGLEDVESDDAEEAESVDVEQGGLEDVESDGAEEQQPGDVDQDDPRDVGQAVPQHVSQGELEDVGQTEPGVVEQDEPVVVEQAEPEADDAAPPVPTTAQEDQPSLLDALEEEPAAGGDGTRR